MPTLDEAIQLFANYARGDGGFDELDLKQVIFDGVVVTEQKRIAKLLAFELGYEEGDLIYLIQRELRDNF
jgi:hypothetical protein